MNNRPNRPRSGRRSIRIPGYDYAGPGDYFVTICTCDRKMLFGEIAGGVMHLNNLGKMIETEWLHTATLRPEISLGAWVIMPNHLHMIVTIRGEDDPRYCTIGAHHLGAAFSVGAHRVRPLGHRVRPSEQGVRPHDAHPFGHPAVSQDMIYSISESQCDVTYLKQRMSRCRSYNDAVTVDDRGPTSTIGNTGTGAHGIPAGAHGAGTGAHGAPLRREPLSLSSVIGGFKSAATSLYKQTHHIGGRVTLWQRNYWESVINTEWQYEAVENYILNNPLAWDRDELNPVSTRVSSA